MPCHAVPAPQTSLTTLAQLLPPPPQHAHTHAAVQNILWSRDKLLVLLRGKGQGQEPQQGENEEGRKGKGL